MTTTWFAALSAIALIAFIALNRVLKRAPEGYENESGFHFGREPQMTMTITQIASDSSAINDQASEDPVEALVGADAA
jgi:hypothetical protein